MDKDNERLTRIDRMRYIKNTSSANLCYLGILADVFFFVGVYRLDVGTWYYQILIGASIVYNLLFLLAVFLSSEGVKNYIKPYSYLLFAAGLGQLIRIFIIPMKARAATTSIGGVETEVMTSGTFTWLIICLVISAVCLIAAAAINYKKCAELAEYDKLAGQEEAVS